MLAWRLTVSAILIPAAIGIFYLDHQQESEAPYLLALCVLLALRATWELADLLKTRSFAPSFALTAVSSVAIIFMSWMEHLELGMMVFALSVHAIFLRGAIRYREPGSSMETVGADVLIVAYVGVLLATTAQLRWVAGSQAGYLALGSLIIAAKAGDIGAYTLGRLFGRKKMVPTLSPGKTWMGAFGALLGSGFGAIAWLQIATPQFNPMWMPCEWYWALLFGVVIGIAGLIGDLCESLIKRDVGRKDSAALMPGFGGLLDLLDSILYAGPIAYVLWAVIPLRTW